MLEQERLPRAHSFETQERVMQLGDAVQILVRDPKRLVELQRSVAAAEAMAAGVPVVASNVPALREVVDPPAGGVVVPPRDAESLAAAIAELMSHSEALARISLTARSSAERFRWQHIARDHLKFLHAVAEMRRGK
jgi:glycosyltransferase involved in cell wall biosynthesis